MRGLRGITQAYNGGHIYIRFNSMEEGEAAWGQICEAIEAKDNFFSVRDLQNLIDPGREICDLSAEDIDAFGWSSLERFHFHKNQNHPTIYLPDPYREGKGNNEAFSGLVDAEEISSGVIKLTFDGEKSGQRAMATIKKHLKAFGFLSINSLKEFVGNHTPWRNGLTLSIDGHVFGWRQEDVIYLYSGRNSNTIKFSPPKSLYKPEEKLSQTPPPVEKTTYESGAKRDSKEGKGRCDLLPASALLRLAKHFESGSIRYGDRNWEKGIPISSFIDSGMRHLLQYMDGRDDEDHLCAAAWNLICAMWTEEKHEDLRNEFEAQIAFSKTGTY